MRTLCVVCAVGRTLTAHPPQPPPLSLSRALAHRGVKKACAKKVCAKIEQEEVVGLARRARAGAVDHALSPVHAA